MSGRDKTFYPEALDAALREARAEKKPYTATRTKVRAGTLQEKLGPIDISDRTFARRWKKALDALRPIEDKIPDGVDVTRLRLLALAYPDPDAPEIAAFCERRGYPPEFAREWIREELAKRGPMPAGPERVESVPARMGND